MNPKQFNPKFGPWAIVTGASSGIGTGYARNLAARGLNIVLVGRRDVVLKEIADQLESAHGIETRIVVADLSESDFLDDVRRVSDDLEVGLLVSNAGAAAMGAMIRVDVNDLKRNLQLNTTAHLILTHHFGKRFVDQGRGGIVLVGSMAGMQGTPFGANYAGSKAYIHMLGQALNYEFQNAGVSVSVIAPGPTETPALTNRTDIDLGQLPGPVMEVTKLVEASLKGLSKNKAMVITGASNKMIDTMSRRIMPRQGARNMMGTLMSKHVPEELKV